MAFENETPVAWTNLPHHAAVVAADGSEIGSASKVLGDVNADIFHGLAVQLGDGVVVELPAARIKRMTDRHVVTDLSEIEAQALPRYSA